MKNKVFLILFINVSLQTFSTNLCFASYEETKVNGLLSEWFCKLFTEHSRSDEDSYSSSDSSSFSNSLRGFFNPFGILEYGQKSSASNLSGKDILYQNSGKHLEIDQSSCVSSLTDDHFLEENDWIHCEDLSKAVAYVDLETDTNDHMSQDHESVSSWIEKILPELSNDFDSNCEHSSSSKKNISFKSFQKLFCEADAKKPTRSHRSKSLSDKFKVPDLVDQFEWISFEEIDIKIELLGSN